MQTLVDIGIIIIIAGAVAVILLYLALAKGWFKRSVTAATFDTPSKLRNIKKLADAGKYSAAIALAYRTFEQMCGAKIGSERMSSETAREYVERVLKMLPLDSAAVENFAGFYEEARFSRHDIDRTTYEAAIRIFTDLYPKIEGSQLSTPV